MRAIEPKPPKAVYPSLGSLKAFRVSDRLRRALRDAAGSLWPLVGGELPANIVHELSAWSEHGEKNGSTLQAGIHSHSGKAAPRTSPPLQGSRTPRLFLPPKQVPLVFLPCVPCVPW